MRVMHSIKPGRGPSALTAFAGIFAVVFGILWTILAAFITREAPGPIGIIFPLFGVVFVLFGIANVIYNLYNATQKKRLSLLDVTGPGEESDPLNELIGDSSQFNGPVGIEVKLTQLDELRKKGIITNTEYTTQRQRILESL
jgi:hypothetical protein